MRKTKRATYVVSYGGYAVTVLATGYNNACIKAFRYLRAKQLISACPLAARGGYQGASVQIQTEKGLKDVSPVT